MRVMVKPVLVIGLGMTPVKLGKKIGETGDYKKKREHPDHSIVKISLNTQRNPGDLQRLTVTS